MNQPIHHTPTASVTLSMMISETVYKMVVAIEDVYNRFSR